MSQGHNHLNHATWECKYHVVFTPKYRKKVLFGQIRRHLGTVFRELAGRKECQIEEGHLMPDHVHILISIPPKYSVAEVIGYLKGKSSIWVAQNVERKARNFLGHKFWARGYFVSTVGRDDDPRLHQEPGDGRSAIGSVAAEARLLIKSTFVPEFFITAYGGSPSNPQLCWGLLAQLDANLDVIVELYEIPIR
jgi:REP-associated tyrosine transposase